MLGADGDVILHNNNDANENNHIMGNGLASYDDHGRDTNT
jgi:hypothetical protein